MPHQKILKRETITLHKYQGQITGRVYGLCEPIIHELYSLKFQRSKKFFKKRSYDVSVIFVFSAS